MGEIVVKDLQRKYGESQNPIRATVNWANIWAVIQENNAMHNFVDVLMVAQQSGEHEDHVLRVLKQHGFKESKIRGQYTNRK